MFTVIILGVVVVVLLLLLLLPLPLHYSVLLLLLSIIIMIIVEDYCCYCCFSLHAFVSFLRSCCVVLIFCPTVFVLAVVLVVLSRGRVVVLKLLLDFLPTAVLAAYGFTTFSHRTSISSHSQHCGKAEAPLSIQGCAIDSNLVLLLF